MLTSSSSIFRMSLEACAWMPSNKGTTYLAVFVQLLFFPIPMRARSRFLTVAAFPSISIQIWSNSLAFSRERLKSASKLRTAAAESFSIMPRSSQHVPTWSHIFSTSLSVTTACLASSASNVIHIRKTNLGCLFRSGLRSISCHFGKTFAVFIGIINDWAILVRYIMCPAGALSYSMSMLINFQSKARRKSLGFCIKSKNRF